MEAAASTGSAPRATPSSLPGSPWPSGCALVHLPTGRRLKYLAFIPSEPVSLRKRLITHGVAHRRTSNVPQDCSRYRRRSCSACSQRCFGWQARRKTWPSSRPSSSRPPSPWPSSSPARRLLLCRRQLLSVPLGGDPLRACQASRERLRLLTETGPRSPCAIGAPFTRSEVTARLTPPRSASCAA
jgi:hypothetical protein